MTAGLGRIPCPKCGETDPEKFAPSKQTHGYCKACACGYTKEYREHNRAKTNAAQAAWRTANRKLIQSDYFVRQYGLTLEEREALFKERDYRCDICGEQVTTPGIHGLQIDHDHETGELRGVLCEHCNVALGNFRDDPVLLHRAIEYLTSRVLRMVG